MTGDGEERPASVLLIAIGNPLRGDDGAGPQVGGLVAAWRIPGLVVRIVHQLVPELAEAVALADRVVMVDATCSDHDGSAELQPLAPASHEGAALGHSLDPSALLRLAQLVFGRHAPAWIVTVPGVHFGFGEGLSSTAERGVNEAVQIIADLVVQERASCTRSA